MDNEFYCSVEDCQCPFYYGEGLCAHGDDTIYECEDAAAIEGEKFREELEKGAHIVNDEICYPPFEVIKSTIK